MTFAADIARFNKKTEASIDKTVRAVTFALFREIVRRTPVDTGRLKGNWQTTQRAPATGTLTTEDKSGAKAIAAITAGMGGWGSVTYLTNNLPYAASAEFGGWNGPTDKVTEAGFSRKAAEGMVRVSFARINSIVRSAARDNKV